MCSAWLGVEPKEGHRVSHPQFIQTASPGLYKFMHSPIFLLTMATLVNRKGHYTRALEEAIQTHHSQWPRAWNGKNPLHGGGSFNKMTPEERVIFKRSLLIRMPIANLFRTAYAPQGSCHLVT